REHEHAGSRAFSDLLHEQALLGRRRIRQKQSEVGSDLELAVHEKRDDGEDCDPGNEKRSAYADPDGAHRADSEAQSASRLSAVTEESMACSASVPSSMMLRVPLALVMKKHEGSSSWPVMRSSSSCSRARASSGASRIDQLSFVPSVLTSKCRCTTSGSPPSSPENAVNMPFSSGARLSANVRSFSRCRSTRTDSPRMIVRSNYGFVTRRSR